MNRTGLSLIELLVASAIMALIAGSLSVLAGVALRQLADGSARLGLEREGLVIMERMASRVRTSSYVPIPNAHQTNRTLLAVSAMVNNDNDFYFGDPLFPRIDEDLGRYLMDSGWGLCYVDDDGDGVADDGQTVDDDEDGASNEEILDGLDNDNDGNIDEDLGDDQTQDGMAGIASMDDDGDGSADNNQKEDNDEDGAKGEDRLDGLLYSWNREDQSLHEILLDPVWSLSRPLADTVLSTNVIAFAASYRRPGPQNDSPLIDISLTLRRGDGTAVLFKETVHPRNIRQKTGRRVR